jgi:hypothetical protein
LELLWSEDCIAENDRLDLFYSDDMGLWRDGLLRGESRELELDGRGYVYDVCSEDGMLFAACDGSIDYVVILSRILKDTTHVGDEMGWDERYGQLRVWPSWRQPSYSQRSLRLSKDSKVL